MRQTVIKLAKQAAPFAWNTSASVAAQGATLVTNFAIIHYTTVHLFGQYSAVQTTVLALVTISQLSAWFSATKFTAELIDRDPHSLEEILGLLTITTLVAGVVASAALMAGANWYATTALRDPSLSTGVLISAGYVCFSTLSSLQAGILLGAGAVRTFARASILLVLPTVVLPTAGAILGGFEGALAGLSLGAALRFGTIEIFLRRELRTRGLQVSFRNFRRNISVLWHFALPATANSFTYAGASWLVSILIVHTQGGFSDVALFGTVSTLKTLALFIPFQINNVSVALINRSAEGHSGEDLFRRNLIFLICFALFSAAALSLLATPILAAYSPSFLRGVWLMRIYMLGSVMEAASYALMQRFSAGRNLWLPFFFGALPRDLIFVLLTIPLISKFAIAGVGLAYALAWLVCTIGYLTLIFLLPRPAYRKTCP